MVTVGQGEKEYHVGRFTLANGVGWEDFAGKETFILAKELARRHEDTWAKLWAVGEAGAKALRQAHAYCRGWGNFPIQVSMKIPKTLR